MSKACLAAKDQSNDQIIETIADRTRRETLRALLSWPTGITTEDLATLVTAAVADVELVEVTRETRRPIHVELVHKHIPKLADAGLVERDTEAGTVDTTDHPALQDGWFRDLLAVEPDDWDHVLTALKSPERRLILAILEEADALDREELARRVAARETNSAPADVPEDAIEETVLALYHVHIPALQQAGMVVYDDGTARYADRPDLELEGLDFHPQS